MQGCGGVQVDFNAVNDYDSINNYKVLQAAFSKLHIDKVLSWQPLPSLRQPLACVCWLLDQRSSFSHLA